MSVPQKLSGKEFEAEIMEAGIRHSKRLDMEIGRFGTTVALIKGKWQPVPSLPDFDCVIRGGRQVIIEAKAVSGRLLDMQKSKLKPSQVRYMLKRLPFGSLCFLLIHFNERKLVKSQTPAITVLLPVQSSDPKWLEFVKTKHGPGISPEAALETGVEVEWTAVGRETKPLPDIYAAVKKLEHVFK